MDDDRTGLDLVGGFLFGNIDEKGKFDDEEMDQELKFALGKLVNDPSLALKIGLSLNNNDVFSETTTKPLLASSLNLHSKNEIQKNLTEKKISFILSKNVLKFTRLYIIGEGSKRFYKLRSWKPKKRKQERPIQYSLDWSEVFRRKNNGGLYVESHGGATSTNLAVSRFRLSRIAGIQKKALSSRIRSIEMSLEFYKKRKFPRICHIIKHSESYNKMEKRIPKPLEVSSWDEQIFFDENVDSLKKSLLTPVYVDVSSSMPKNISNRSFIGASRSSIPISNQFSPKFPQCYATRIQNIEFAFGYWSEQILWDVDESVKMPSHLILNLNDPNLVLDIKNKAELDAITLKNISRISKMITKAKMKAAATTKAGQISGGNRSAIFNINFSKIQQSDRMNLSNDKYYMREETVSKTSIIKNATQKVDSGILLHSVPALKLSQPFFRTHWTKNEMRLWHRPRFEAAHIRLEVMSLKSPKNSKSKNNSLVIRNAKKMNLNEVSSSFIMIEYSEETPSLMQNVGMASRMRIVTRTMSKEAHSSELSSSSNIFLNAEDPPVFGALGDVSMEKSMNVFENNLFKAPAFVHESNNQNFLLLIDKIRGKTGMRAYIIKLPEKVYLIGQTLPKMEVYSPHSRRHNQYCKQRIQVASYRLFQKDSSQKLRISRISQAFPQFSDGSIRKWMKEYADSLRAGKDSGYWKMRNDAPKLTEEDLRSLLPPEQVCIYESMLYGQQKLLDTGFSVIPSNETDESYNFEDKLDENKNVIFEQDKKAPWNITTNLISASLGKVALIPPEIGEYLFSGIKQENLVYKKTIPSLSQSSENPSKNEKERERDRKLKNTRELSLQKTAMINSWNDQVKFFQANKAIDGIVNSNQLIDTDSQFSETKIIDQNEMRLIINRTMINELTGEIYEEQEIIHDSQIINTYLKQRRVIEVKRRRRRIALEAGAIRSKNKNLKNTDSNGENSSSTKMSSSSKKLSKSASINQEEKLRIKKEMKMKIRMEKLSHVKCGTCGEVGHMRTNKSCPRFFEYEEALRKKDEIMPHLPSITDEAAIKVSGTKLAISKASLKMIEDRELDLEKIKLERIKANKKKKESKKSKIKAIVQLKKASQTKEILIAAMKEKQSAISKQNELIDFLFNISNSWPFHKPVSKRLYPQYYKNISRPIDLGTIRTRVKRGIYAKNWSKLKTDVQRIRENCEKFNGPDENISIWAREVESNALEWLSQNYYSNIEEAKKEEGKVKEESHEKLE